MRKRYPTGQRFALTRPETMYRTNDAGLCCGLPVSAGAGVVVQVIERPAAWTWDWPAREHRPEVLAQATIDGAPCYGWLSLGWLEPIDPQRELFAREQPQLF